MFPQRFHIYLSRFRLRILDISSCETCCRYFIWRTSVISRQFLPQVYVDVTYILKSNLWRGRACLTNTIPVFNISIESKTEKKVNKELKSLRPTLFKIRYLNTITVHGVHCLIKLHQLLMIPEENLMHARSVNNSTVYHILLAKLNKRSVV